MNGNKVATSVRDEQQRSVRLVAALPLGGLIIGAYLGGLMLARVNADAPMVASIKVSEGVVMNEKKSSPIQRRVQTPSGRISYTEQGTGPVALFVHGVLLNGYLWRHQLADLSDIRRCIAVDLLAHGDTEIAPNQDVSVTANANMLKEFLDVLKIDQVDLIGNDSGAGIAQIFAALYPERIRSLTLTDGDTHDNWPPQAFKPFLAMAAAGGLPGTLKAMIADKNVYRSPQVSRAGVRASGTRQYRHHRTVSLSIGEERAADAGFSAFPGGLRQQAHACHRRPIEDVAGADPDCLGNGRCVFRCEVGSVPV